MSTTDEKRKIKIPNLFRAIFMVYSWSPLEAIIKDVTYILITVIEMTSIGVGGRFIDETARILMNWDRFDLFTFFQTKSFKLLVTLTALQIALILVNNVKSYVIEVIYNKFHRIINYKIVDKISEENLQELEQNDFQELVVFVRNYSINNIIWAYENFSDTIQQSIRLVSSFALIYQNVGFYGIFLLVFAAPEVISNYTGLKNIAKYQNKTIRRKKFIDYINSLLIDINNFPELKVASLFDYFKDLVNSKSDKQDKGFFKKQAQRFKGKTLFSIVDQILFRGYAVFIIAVSVIKRLTIGQFKALYDYSTSCFDSAYNVMREIFMLKKNSIYIEKYFELMKYEGFGDLSSGTVILSGKTPRIEFDSLDFKYPVEQVKALENVSFSIEPGEKVAFFGGDGSGKTTLQKVLCGLYEITAGDYYIDNYSIRELARGELKKKFSLLEDDFVRYNFSIKKNIIVGKMRIHKERYEKVKKLTGVDKFMKKQGLDDDQILGKFFSGGREISPGYWQKLAIARTLYNDKQIYVLDEPFTYLDSKTAKVLLKRIIDFLGDDKTMIVISRHEDNIRMYDKIFYLKDGKVSKR